MGQPPNRCYVTAVVSLPHLANGGLFGGHRTYSTYIKEHFNMSQPKIIAYMKPVCGWSNGVRAIFAKYSLDYEDRDIINDENNYREMVQKTRQPYQPCVQIDDVMLADVSGDEVEEYLVSEGLVQSSDAATDVPTDQACEDHGPTAVNIGFSGR